MNKKELNEKERKLFNKLQNENFDLRQQVSDLQKQIDVERWQGLAYWEDFKKLKKFVLYFKRDIEEGLKGNYKKGENIILEAWDAVKPNIKYEEAENDEGVYMEYILYLEIEEWKPEAFKIKKALEVQNDNL